MSRHTKMILMFTTVLIMSSFSVPVPARQTQLKAEVALKNAMEKETVDGDLKAAIDQYQAITKMPGASRAVVAKALLQLGGCYQKKGSAEARKTYERLAKEFTDLPEIAAQAAARLVTLAPPLPTNKADRGIVLREVRMPLQEAWEEVENVWRISPDGRFVAYFAAREIDPNRAFIGLGLYDIQKEKKLDLGAIKPCDRCELGAVSDPTWSPDGKQLAFTRGSIGTKAPLDNATGSMTDLCVVDNDGTNFRVLYSSKDLIRNILFGIHRGIVGWSLDGKTIFVHLQGKEKIHSLARILLQGGELTEIKTFGRDAVRRAITSPDGNFIAYELVHSEDPKSIDLRILSLDGGGDESVAKNLAQDAILDWAPDGRHILFSSSRGGKHGIWALPIRDGKSEGDVLLVKNFNGTIGAHGFTNSGSFYFRENIAPKAAVYTAQIDLDSGKALRRPEIIDLAFEGATASPFWSNDGDYLAYLLVTNGDGLQGYSQALRIHSMKTGKNRDISLTLPTGVLMQPARWSPDGKYIYAAARNSASKKYGLLRVNVETGQNELIVEGPVWGWSADGNDIFLMPEGKLSNNKLGHGVMQKDLRTGNEKEIFPIQEGLTVIGPSVSPDGRWFGGKLSEFLKTQAERDPAKNGIFVLPIAGGPRISLSLTKSDGAFFFWGPPGKGLLFENILKSGKSGLSYLPSFESREIRQLDFPEMNRINGLTFHPDGKTIAFHSLAPDSSKDWVMENFLPPAKNK